MKLGWIAGAVALIAVATAVASCGTADSSVFAGGGLEDAGPDLSEAGIGFGKGDSGGGSGNGACKPLSCKDQGISCGQAGDGCGGKITCGSCTTPQTCGGGGKPSVCGGTDGCVPKTCKDLGITCGPAGDGCGGTLPNCGTCNAPEFCGGGGPSKCGGGLVGDGGVQLLPDGGVCSPRTTCSPNECGPIADGCGGLLVCPVCPSGTTCGGGGTPSVCGAPKCVKTSCAGAGADCGYIADGCGNLLDCGGPNACAVGFCGGGGPNKCGTGVDGGVACVNFCQNQVNNCPGGGTTSITGTVLAPNGTLPLPGAIVYVPNASKVYPYGIATLTDGVSGGVCDSCSATASGSPLVSTVSGFDGSFTLTNVPAGVPFPLVIQMGHWRRVVTVPAVTACTSASVAAALTRLPKTQGEGGTADNIPLFALTTGQVDGLECVFRKLGVADNQFGNPGSAARIQLYQDTESGGTAAPGARINASTPAIDTLIASQAQLEKYDAVIFACTGAPANKSPTARSYVYNYANEGGRVFATHYNYTWLYDANGYVSSWGGAANFIPDNPSYDNNASNDTGLVSTTAKGGLFDKWLGVTPSVNALSATGPDRVALSDPRYDAFTPLGAGAEAYITQYNPANPVPVFHFTFNTPLNAATQCGRVIFSDFHVAIGNTYNATFPNECNNNPLTAQEKILAFMLFDLTSCIQTITPTCPKQTCGMQTCGPAGDGCGGQLDCGTCAPNQVCQGSPSQCITPQCTKAVCKAGQCGTLPDGCNGTIDCGNCQGGQICGGGGPNVCGNNACAPTTCQAQGVQCGPTADGCGNLLQCGSCPAGQMCGANGKPGVCGTPACTKRTCAQAGANCGSVADGCGGLLDCGTCTNGKTCGGGGVANQCGGAVVK